MTVLRMAARTWQKQASTSWISWWASPACQAHYNAAVCGQPVTGSSEGCRVRLGEALAGRCLKRGVSIGCGAGAKEIALLVDGLVHELDLWEIAPRFAVEGSAAADRAGVGARLHYTLGDALKENRRHTYDLVYWDHSLHHMSDVRKALAWSVEAVKPAGYILINDYVGPNRLQFSPFEVTQANAFLERHGLSQRLRHSTPLTRLRQWYRDPSEAPQSEFIEGAIRDLLPGAEVLRIGGTFLNMLGNFVVSSVDDANPVLHAMLLEDAELRQRGCSHFAFSLWNKSAS